MLKRRFTAFATAGVLACALAACTSTTAATVVAEAQATEVVQTQAIPTPDTSAEPPDASTTITLASEQDVVVSEAGTYTLVGQAHNATVIVDAADTDEVTLVLDSLEVTNDDFPVIYVKSADKVRVEGAEGTESVLSVNGTFVSDGDTETDGVIYSKDDLVLAGEGTILINSAKHGVVSKDDLKVKGGTLVITAASKALSANDTLTVEGGTLQVGAAEALEATIISLEGGDIAIQATDDAINATAKSDKTDLGSPTIAMSGGNVAISMAQGDTDALDSNGNILISGGTLVISAQSAFDFDGIGELTGGTVTVNGEEVTTLTNSMMGGRMGGGGFGRRGF